MQSQFQAKQQGTWVTKDLISYIKLFSSSRRWWWFKISFSDISGGGGAGGYRASGFGPSPLQGSALELYAGS